MLKPAQARFCALYAVSMDGKAAYMEAFPKAAPLSAEAAASRLLRSDKVQAEIERIRQKAETRAGGAVLNLEIIHDFLYRLVTCAPAMEPRESNLWQSVKITEDGTEYRLPDKLAAIARFCDLKSKGSAANAQDAITAMIERAMK